MRRAYEIAALMLVFCLVLVLGWIFLPGEDDSLARARAGGVLRVGYALEAPFVLLQPEPAASTPALRVSGEAPEVLRAALARVGITRLEWLRADFGSLIHELESGRIDVIAAGMFITPARSQRVAFSRPSVALRTGLLQPADLLPITPDLAELQRFPQRRLAVLEGSVEAALARSSGFPEARLIAYPDAPSALDALQRGRVEALALSSVSLRYMQRSLPVGAYHLSPDVAPDAPPGLAAFAVRKQDHALREALDRALAEFLGSAEHLALVVPFGIAAADLPEARP